MTATAKVKTKTATDTAAEIPEAKTYAVAKTSPTTPYQLLQVALESGTGIEQIERLMGLQERWEANQARKSYLLAKSAFQAALPIIKKTKTASFPAKNGGGQVTYPYASLDDITESIKPYLKEHGLSYAWDQEFNAGGWIKVTCTLTHSDGHSETNSMVGQADNSGAKNTLQASASTVSYLRRYTLTGVAGIASADPDLDGRLPELITTNSNTLNDLLADDDGGPTMSVEDYILSATTPAELKRAGSMIPGVKGAAEQKRLKTLWFKMQDDMRATKANAEAGECPQEV